MRVSAGHLILTALLCCGMALAMHEDEQGKRDWLRKGLGAVNTAVFHPKAKTLKQLYVASEDGVLAALSTLNEGMIRWRHVTSPKNHFVCISASENMVTAVTSQGHVYAFAASTGEVLSLRKLELPAGGAASSCSSSVAVAFSGSSVTWYRLNDPSESVAVAATGSATLQSPVTGAKVGNTLIWVDRNGTGIDTINLADGSVATSSIAAVLKASSTSDETLVEASDAQSSDKTFTLLGEGIKPLPEPNPTQCKNCKAALLSSVETGSSDGIVVVSRPAKDQPIKIQLGSKSVDLHWDVRGTPSVLAARSSPLKTELVLVSSSAHVLYVAFTSGDESARWELLEGLSLPALVMVVPQPRLDAKEDHFGFRQLAVVLSKRGTLYSVPVWAPQEAHVVADVMAAILTKAGEVCWCGASYKSLTVDAAGDVVTIVAEKSGSTFVVKVELSTKTVLSVSSVTSRVLVTPGGIIQHNSLPAPATERQFLFSVDEAAGEITGFAVARGSRAVEPTWTVQLLHPIAATASGQLDPLQLKTVESIRIFPNSATKLNEVRRKYPTTNVLVTAHYVPVVDELTSLVITAVDTITGSVLMSTRHANVEGPVKLLLVENMIVYHFLDAETMQFKIGVLELFEQEEGATISDSTPPSIPQIIGSLLFSSAKTFSSFAARPPLVSSTVLKFQHDVTSMGVTTSYGGIARKLVLFATPSGRVHSVDLRSLTVGGNAHPQHPQSTFGYIITPSANLATHRYQLASPQMIATNPTELESSSHVLVAGVDLFYVRLSAGKAFDLLNDDFNHDMLLLVCGVMGALCLVARFVAKPRALYQQWA
jgi:hypothetical protein